MRMSRDMREIRSLRRDAVEPEKIARLIETLDENYGYVLYRAVSRLKEALSADVQVGGAVGAPRFEGALALDGARYDELDALAVRIRLEGAGDEARLTASLDHRGARALDVDHVTVARRIAALEAASGLKLVDRRTRLYHLTADGERIAAPGAVRSGSV